MKPQLYEPLTPGADISWDTPDGQTRTGVIWCSAPKPMYRGIRVAWREIQSGDAAWVIPDTLGEGEHSAIYVRWVKPKGKPFKAEPHQTVEDVQRSQAKWFTRESAA